MVCGGDFNTPLVNNVDLNGGVGIFGAVKEATDSGKKVQRNAATTANNVMTKGTYNTLLHDGSDQANSATSNVKVHVGGKSNGPTGKASDYSIDGVVIMHFHAGTRTAGPAYRQMEV